MLTNDGETRFLTGLKKGVRVRYRYFDLSDTKAILLTVRGKGAMDVLCDGNRYASLDINCADWTKHRVDFVEGAGKRATLEFLVRDGKIELLQFECKAKR